MKRILTFFIACAISLSMVATAFAGTLTVATDTNFPPFEFKDPKTGEHTGFDVEIWAAIAKEIGVEYKLQPMAFKGIVPGLQSSQLDAGIAGMSITDKRREVIDFSDGYYNSGLLLLVKADDDSITGLKTLDGKVIATKQGTTSVEFLKENATPKDVKLFPNDNAMFMELLTGGVDAVMFDKPVVESFVSKRGKGQVKIVGDLYAGQPYGIGFPKGSELVGKVNAALKTLKENGTYTTLYKKWFGVAPR
ncbi:glutamine ABC transporter substrate-binding protein GlnH [Pseudodesulfovibrio sp. JC047]|uniref:glutamine ABC transporter substrate-binding protein GlnH n=1 Tax=Pseudodesulfovibrio sp. JC047 TaxID=2683199 RepID=UPI0013D725F5|nr:glutamine ABC transporter substrate-binding protein GlnH [Pseudodesulfovibrio sp. JC047]NDV20670.1 glutamine ABC transporter substrate-binding protein GlnH [Pseudodesulfovibrio sp. JC047]